jgi:hypothetical protein
MSVSHLRFGASAVKSRLTRFCAIWSGLIYRHFGRPLAMSALVNVVMCPTPRWWQDDDGTSVIHELERCALLGQVGDHATTVAGQLRGSKFDTYRPRTSHVSLTDVAEIAPD